MSSLTGAPDDQPTRIVGAATASAPQPAAAGPSGPGDPSGSGGLPGPGDPPGRGGPPAPIRAVARVVRRRGDALATVALGALLVAACLTMGGAGTGPRATVPAIAAALLGALAVAAAVVLAPAGRRVWGGLTLLSFVALVALSAVSISWSIQPDSSWRYVNLLLAYLGVFAGAMALAHLAAARWRALLGAVVLASVVVSAYALVTKVFPTLEPLDMARVRAPFDYWNAVGLMGALGIPGCLWLGARRDGHQGLRTVSIPALTILLVTVLLSYGRGAIAVVVATCVLWFAVVPLRLRSAAVFGAALAGTAVIGAWATANDALSLDGVPREIRSDAGLELGLLLVAVLVVMLLAGGALSFATARAALAPATRRAIGATLLVLVALVPLAGVARLAASDRGLVGSVEHAWHQLTDPDAQQPGNDPSRLGEVSGMRARYWDTAFKIWDWAPLHGTGADTYATASRPLQVSALRAGHAHGYVPQTAADLGWLGLGVSAALLLAWLVAATRATALRPPWRLGAWAVAAARARTLRTPLHRRPPTPWTAERIGLVTLALTAVAFGLHSAIDWTWFIPGTAITGLGCAGWVAARGPLAEAPARVRLPRPSWVERPRYALAAATVLAGLAAAWSIWQPQRAYDAEHAALAALDEDRPQQARAHAERAAELNPLSIDPLLTLATIEQAAGDEAAARRALEDAVALQPANADGWKHLGLFELERGDGPAAVRALSAAVFLDPQSPALQQLLANAQAAAGARAAPADPSTPPSGADGVPSDPSTPPSGTENAPAAPGDVPTPPGDADGVPPAG